VFPSSRTLMSSLDSISRRPLWSVGMNFNHGVGHGVGSLLVVHEKPYYTGDNTIVEKGMMLTIEPGLYIENKFGVRIESVGTVVDHPDFPGFLRFDVVTRVPISPKLVEPLLLTQTEKEWLNNYNKLCFDSLSPLLTAPEDAIALEYLKKECTPIQ